MDEADSGPRLDEKAFEPAEDELDGAVEELPNSAPRGGTSARPDGDRLPIAPDAGGEGRAGEAESPGAPRSPNAPEARKAEPPGAGDGSRPDAVSRPIPEGFEPARFEPVARESSDAVIRIGVASSVSVGVEAPEVSESEGADVADGVPETAPSDDGGPSERGAPSEAEPGRAVGGTDAVPNEPSPVGADRSANDRPPSDGATGESPDGVVMSTAVPIPLPGVDGGGEGVAESGRAVRPASAAEPLLIEGAPEIDAVALPSARLRPLPAGIDGAGGTLGAPDAPAAARGFRGAIEGEFALPTPEADSPRGVVPVPPDGGTAEGEPAAEPEASDAGGVAPNGRAPPRPVAGGSDGGADGVGDEDEKPPPEVRRAGAEGGAEGGASGRSVAPRPLALPTAGPERGVLPERLAEGKVGEPAGAADPAGAVASVGFERGAPKGDAAGG